MRSLSARTSPSSRKPPFECTYISSSTFLLVKMHYSLWGVDADEYARCTVVGYAGAHTFPDGKVSRYTFIIEHEGHHYPVRHTAVASSVEDASTRRRLRKAPPPRAIH